MNPQQININDFTYNLPENKIAKFPLDVRHSSKLLIYKNQKISDDTFINLSSYLSTNSCLVFNDTKVIQARLLFKNKNGASIEVFCLEPAAIYSEVTAAMLSQDNVVWTCLVGNLKKWKDDELILVKNDFELKASQLSNNNSTLQIQFSWNKKNVSFAEVLDLIGVLPIPPYLKRDTTAKDLKDYQTIYAKHKGSVAAPTAGLHFTDDVLNLLKQKKCKQTFVTLHVGAGTFMPVKSNTLVNHNMHEEWIEVEKTFIENLITEEFIVAVGTTSLRTIETLYWMGIKAAQNKNAILNEIQIKQWDAYDLKHLISKEESLIALTNWMQKNSLTKLVCKTQILIAPPYKLKIAKAIITNFHQPESTLLLLIASVVGMEWKTIYEHALQHNYRFLSFGDSSLLFSNTEV